MTTINDTKEQRVTAAVMRELLPVCYAKETPIYKAFDKEDKARRYCRRFAAKMNSAEPYATPEEAIQALAPVAVWFIGWAARQFAIMVLKALWRHWHSDTE